LVTSPITEHLILAARERKDVQKISLSFSSLQKVDKTLAVVVDDDDDDQFTHLLDYFGMFVSAENSHKNLLPKKPTQSLNLSQLHIHTSAVIFFQLEFPQKSPKEKPTQINLSQLHLLYAKFSSFFQVHWLDVIQKNSTIF
jgi:hypothetical protein